MKKYLLLLFVLGCINGLSAQDLVYKTFKDTRVINSQSTETLGKRKLDIRIGHRFGDLAGDAGGWPTFYGLENASDVSIGAEYGVTDRFMVGLSRTKGAATLKQLINPMIKYKLLQQKTDGAPLSIAAFGIASISTMQKNETNPEALNFFETFSHRVVYTAQFIFARKFSDQFSLQATPSITHRNLAPFGESNDIFSFGLASRFQVSKVMAVLLDATIPLAETHTAENGYYVPFGIGLEFDTGGHVFQINLTNARGMAEPDYIPNTRSSWGDGEFRLGFTISRLFNL